MKHTIKVTGMTCGGCERAVTAAVKKVAGVTEVKADHTTNTVEFDSLDNTVDMDLIVAYIKRVGFNVEH